MELDNAQRAKISEWISQGLKLSEIQNRLSTELSLKLTYMEVRMLVDDLKLTPKDPEPPAKPATPAAASVLDPKKQNQAAGLAPQQDAGSAPVPGGVSVYVDQITRPGALVSGKVTFSDGMKAEWHLDQTGRLGLAAQQQGYRPTAADIQQFQAALQEELGKLGY